MELREDWPMCGSCPGRLDQLKVGDRLDQNNRDSCTQSTPFGLHFGVREFQGGISVVNFRVTFTVTF